jgi:hypothetical protein
MPLNRRHFLTTGALALGATALPGLPCPAAAAPRRAPAVVPAAFIRLPPGSVTPRGWLAGQLRLQLDGLCGRYAEVSHFLDFDTSGWAHPENTGWEEVPYWLRGYVPLAVATADAAALATVRKWVDAILATQQSDGFFGPRALRTQLNGGPDFWPFLPLLMALRTYAEYTEHAGDADDRIVPFLTRFLRFMNDQGPGAFDTSWVSYRWGDGIDVTLWLYERTGEAFLLGLAGKMHTGGVDWTADTLPTPHNVNIAQGFREPAQYAQFSGSADLTRATYRVYDSVLARYGQFAGGGIAGDENVRPDFGDPRQGFETCGIVEFMASHEILTRITGDPVWADRCEELAFNMLPAALDPQGRGTHYITSANCVDLDNTVKTQGQFQNGFAMQAFQPGVDQYRCCPHNYGMGWPYFSEELWLATSDGGLAAAMYAASTVSAKVGGTTVTVTEETDYPFDETITLTVSPAKPVAFPLRLRVPGWCRGPEITVGGEPVTAQDGPAFVTINRTWADGDVVRVRLPQRTTVRTWSGNHDAVSVDHGPLTYSLRIGEEYVRYSGDSTFPQYEVHATTPWNYALDLDSGLTFSRDTAPVADNPFTQDGAPVRITAGARRLPGWVADDEHVIAPLQQSPALATASVEPVTLIPMGAARLRITSFPTASPGGTVWTAEPPFRRILNKNSNKVLAVDGMSTANSARVVQFDNTPTGDHAWQLVDRGDGWCLIRNGYSGKVLGVDGMSTANSARVVQYEDNGTPDHLWQLVDRGDGWYLIRNKNSGKVLGVDAMSTANSAQVVQYDDNGTDDHLWKQI